MITASVTIIALSTILRLFYYFNKMEYEIYI